MRFKPDIEQVRKRMDAFWAQEMLDRAMVAVLAPKYKDAHISMFHNPQNLQNKPEELRAYWEDPQTIHANNLRRLEQTHLGGDAIPVVFQNYGTSGHCNYFGARPTYGNDTIWFDPVWQSLQDAAHAHTETSLARHLAIAEYLTAHAKDDYFVGMPDSTGTLDAIGHLYGTNNVLVDMIDEPEELKEAIRIVNDGWVSSNEKFYQISRLLNGGGVHAWMHLMAPGRLTHMQCDMSVMFSHQDYAEFAMEELHRQMEWLEYPVYHFDGIEQTRHLDFLLGLDKLKAIQWTHVAGQKSAAHYLDVLQRMQHAGKSLIIMAPPEDVEPLLDGLSAKGLYIHTEAETPEQADALVRIVEKNSKE